MTRARGDGGSHFIIIINWWTHSVYVKQMVRGEWEIVGGSDLDLVVVKWNYVARIGFRVAH